MFINQSLINTTRFQCQRVPYAALLCTKAVIVPSPVNKLDRRFGLGPTVVSKRYHHLISTSELSNLLISRNVKVVDGSWHMPTSNRNAKQEYQNQHIPSAVFFDIDEVADKSTNLPHMLPSPQLFDKVVGQLGIATDDNVVVYDSVGVNTGCRAWWTFHVFGHKKLWFLDGGLPKWIREGRPTEIGIPSVKPQVYKSAFNPNLVKHYEEMVQHLQKPKSDPSRPFILDARSEARFLGTAPEPRAGLISGHMPGAISVPFDTLVDKKSGELLKKDKLKAVFQSKNVDLSKPIITTCGSGVTASIVYLALREAGANNVSLYDGSWTEYASRAGSVIVKGNKE